MLAQASAAETRTKELRQKGWSTDAQWDQAKAAADEARARLNRAERQVELTKNSLSPATRTYLAKFSMPGVGDEVQLGMTAMLILSEPASERVARLPLSALFDQGAGPCVYTADAATGAITLKPVSVKAYESNDVLISGGVEEGAKVVTLGVQKLNPAEKVKVVSSLSF